MRKDIVQRKAEIELWVSQMRPKASICLELKCRPLTLDMYLKKFGIEYKGNMGGRGYRKDPKRKSASEFLHYGSTISSHKLKLKLLQDNIKRQICESCNRTKWLGKLIPLELHHINGDRFDNRLLNLQLLCPNCHSLTDNYSGRKSQIV